MFLPGKPALCSVVFHMRERRGMEGWRWGRGRGGEDFNNVLMQVCAVIISSPRKAQIATWIQRKETFQLVKEHERFQEDECEWH